ncbi:MAG: formate--tetrahydrofolate ligase [Planctomycetia bacterium]|nr:formate--tetrahydrofolate ligase [Planctomycetia bacterium]
MVKSDLEIAQEATLKPIGEIASELGIEDSEIELYGPYKAKITLDILERLKDRPTGKYITVTAITPTPLGEGKTVTALGLGQGLAKIGKRACNTLREPSKGPTFGIKGGACGGGYSQVVPMEDINLHFTGDIHAIETAHNLFNAALDASLLHKNPLNIDPMNINLRRCVDISDRVLRDIVVGLGGKANGIPRQTGYDITVASETAAVHALAISLRDLRERLGKMICGFTYDGKPVTAEDLKVAGAMTVLMKDSIKPNLVQSLENTPVIDHGVPFANVAHGNNSVLADLVALKLVDYVVTESGFGADCGAEKLIDIKCRQSGLKLDCAVITCSLRALKMHGGAFVLKPGQSYASIKKAAESENMAALEKGCENLRVHLENMLSFGIPVVVIVNRFTFDTDRESDFVVKYAMDHGAFGAAPIQAWASGGAGCTEAAELIVKACDEPNDFHFLYPDDFSIKEKIETICTKIYRADGVDYSPLAEKKIKLYTELGFDKLCINMAKTHLSLSHDPALKGAPTGFRVPVRDVRASVGAGFLYPLLGAMRTMPGLPSKPAFQLVDIDENGKTVGLF